MIVIQEKKIFFNLIKNIYKGKNIIGILINGEKLNVFFRKIRDKVKMVFRIIFILIYVRSFRL